MNDHKEIQTKIVNLVAKQLEIEPMQCQEEKSFADLGADHLAQIELIMRLEDLFNLEIHDEDAQYITNVRTAVSYIAKRKTISA